MDFLRALAGQLVPPTSTDVDQSGELQAEVEDEPPLENKTTEWSATEQDPTYNKAMPLKMPVRRESLITRALHSENDQSDTDTSPPTRALSTHSMWSMHSTTSTAELTSDDGRSVSSPAISPPLAPTNLPIRLPALDKPLDRDVKIVGQDGNIQKQIKVDDSVEANLGRKRCISFRCGDAQPKSAIPAVVATEPVKSEDVRPAPVRKTTLKFACPTKTVVESRPVSPTSARCPTISTPQPPSQPEVVDNVTAGAADVEESISPKSLAVPIAVPTPARAVKVPYPDSDDSGDESTRFHVFGASEDEQEAWVKESTCHRSRLTINDTLKKENVIRKACEDVEKEVEEEDDEEDEDEAGDDEVDVDDNFEFELDGSEDEDDGFHSDNEEGFADSDSDSDAEGSDYEWWKPAARSTATTSVEHLDTLAIPKPAESLASSVGTSISSGRLSLRSSRHQFHRNAQKARRSLSRSQTKPIDLPVGPELPDSTDFVCGTLDEDRPHEQAYLNAIKEREAAKHKPRPQDIDPTFPTSDPEMDEEDDDDLEDPVEDDDEENNLQLSQSNADEVEGVETVRRHSSTPKVRATARSPPPPAMNVKTTARSPPPIALQIKGTARSPLPPALKLKGTARSPPPPALKMKGVARSPPPPKRRKSPAPAAINKRGTNKSPPPTIKLAGRSPVPNTKISEKPTPLTQPDESKADYFDAVRPFDMAKNHLTQTASLPRTPGGFLSCMEDNDGSDTPGASTVDVPRRGAIDIVKGLERRRQRRKEKLYQKAVAKAAAKSDKPTKVKPGRGAERMRELGLELQRYHGKGEFILSA